MLLGEWVFPRHIPMWDSVVGGEYSQWNSDFLYGLWKYNPSKTKKIKWLLSASESEHETDENFYQFIVIKSIEETPITKLSSFLIQKTIKTHCKPIIIQKAMNNTIIIQTINQKQPEKILKWKQFGRQIIKTYPHPTHNFSKGVIISPDLTSCSLEEIRLHPKPQGVTDVRRISICKETRTIDTNTYILTFNKSTTPTSIRIGYINAKIETYIPNPLRCQKYGHPKDKCTRPPICAKWGNPNHTELECKNPFNWINCTGEHPAYSWECVMWKKELQK